MDEGSHIANRQGKASVSAEAQRGSGFHQSLAPVRFAVRVHAASGLKIPAISKEARTSFSATRRIPLVIPHQDGAGVIDAVEVGDFARHASANSYGVFA